jgi:myosin heavy subunit
MIEPLSNGATYLVLTFYASASTFQTHFRRAHCVRRIQPILEKNRAALKIQCLWRCYDATIELQCRNIHQEATVAIQKLWRGFQQRSVSTRKIDSIMLLQARARGYLARSKFRKRHKSAISIQCLWRGFWAQLQTQLDLMDVIAVQSMARRWLAVHDRDARRRAVFVLQRNARIFLATRAFNLMRVERQQLIRRLAVAVLCQVSVPLICSLLR